MKVFYFAAILLLSLSACGSGHNHDHDDHPHDENHDHSSGHNHDSPGILQTDSTQQNFIIEPDSLPAQSPQ